MPERTRHDQTGERVAEGHGSGVGVGASAGSGSGSGSGAAAGPTGRLVLASASPRRLELLRAAGFDPDVEAADIDDGSLVLGDVGAAATATSLAYFKARRVAALRRRRGASPRWILAADTVCERDGAVLGKPADRAHAREMIRSLASRRHGVLTGWCLLSPDAGVRLGLARASVEIGSIPAEELERFLAEDRWKGKAGGYNLPEVVVRGWPVRCDGDEHAVVGLPIREIAPILREVLGGSP
jgi:septum formation protein